MKRVGLHYTHFRNHLPLFIRLPGSQNPKNCQNLHRVAKVGLASFEKIIPLKYPSDLQGSTTLTAKLLTRSEGTIGELKMLLAAVATDAMRNGTERITEEIIATCNYVPPSARKQRSVSG